MASKSKRSTKLTRQQLSEGIFQAVSAQRIEQLREDLQKAERINILVFENLNFLITGITTLIDAVSDFNPGTFKSYYIGVKEIPTETEELSNLKEQIKTTLEFFKQKIETDLDKKQSIWLTHIKNKILGPAHNVTMKLSRPEDQTAVSKLLDILKNNDADMHAKVISEINENKTAFLIRNFRKAGELKSEIVDYIFDQVFSLVDPKTGKLQSTLTPRQVSMKTLVKSGIHRGHGAGAGSAVAYVAVAEGIASISKNLDIDHLLKYIEADFTQLEVKLDPNQLQDIKNIIINWDSLVDPKTGKVKADYIPYIEFQDSSSNTSVDARREKLVAQSVRRYIASLPPSTIAEATSSPSLKDQMISVAIAPIFGIELSSKNLKKVRAKISKNYIVSGSGLRLKGQEAFKNKISRKKVTYRKVSSKINPPRKRPPNINKPVVARSSSSSGFNQLQLVGILNASLPPVVRKNMQYPALQNRTGLFSESVKVTSIDQTPKGFPSISYTYDKIPYQVFEMGIGKSPWATPERDPRKLIDKSVRELAAEYMTQRFYTKRV
jgi:flagellar motility protein MotE (MotC chaperone)